MVPSFKHICLRARAENRQSPKIGSTADPRFDLGFDRILSARGVCHGASLTLSGPDQLVACGQRVWIQSGELPVSELLFLH